MPEDNSVKVDMGGIDDYGAKEGLEGKSLEMSDMLSERAPDRIDKYLSQTTLDADTVAANLYGAGTAAIANPSPVGLLGFAIVSWLAGVLKVHHAMYGDALPINDGILASIAIFLGGVAQIFAGLLQFPKNNTHSATVFLVFGLHWLSVGFMNAVRLNGAFPGETHSLSEMVYYAALTAATIVLWVPSLRMNSVLCVTLASVICVFTMDAVAAYGVPAAEGIAGALACVAATLAFYMCLVDVVNEAWGRPLLPIFPHKLHKHHYEGKLKYIPGVHFHKSTVAGVQV